LTEIKLFGYFSMLMKIVHFKDLWLKRLVFLKLLMAKFVLLICLYLATLASHRIASAVYANFWYYRYHNHYSLTQKIKLKLFMSGNAKICVIKSTAISHFGVGGNSLVQNCRTYSDVTSVNHIRIHLELH